jgi:hypothetical protein
MIANFKKYFTKKEVTLQFLLIVYRMIFVISKVVNLSYTYLRQVHHQQQ